MPRRERCYKGFIVSWKEPPVSANKWAITVSPEDPGTLGKTQLITGDTLEEAWAKARKFIDELPRLGGNPTQWNDFDQLRALSPSVVGFAHLKRPAPLCRVAPSLRPHSSDWSTPSHADTPAERWDPWQCGQFSLVVSRGSSANSVGFMSRPVSTSLSVAGQVNLRVAILENQSGLAVATTARTIAVAVEAVRERAIRAVA